MKRAGIIFTETVMALTSEAAVISYDSTVDLRSKFTTDTDGVRDIIEHLPIGVDDSLLYDAMARGISMLNERPAVRRRIMLVVGEARDSGSEARLGEVLRQAQLSNVTIYSDWVEYRDGRAAREIRPRERKSGLAGPGDMAGENRKKCADPQFLAIASKATGGPYTNPVKDRSIEKGMDAIGGELHAQYTISYRPSGEEDLDGYHEIKVLVDRPNVTVRARPGYYIAPLE